MSVSRPARCLFARASSAIPTAAQPSPMLGRLFSTTAAQCTRRRVKVGSLKASEMGNLVKEPAPVTSNLYKPYTKAEKAALAKRYTPEQIRAIEAGEEAVDTEDLATQGTIRNDPFGLRYVDDLSHRHAVVDKPVRNPESNYDPKMRLKTEREFGEDVTQWFKDLPEEPDKADWLKFKDNVRHYVGKEEAERAPVNYTAPKINKFNDPELRYHKAGDETDPQLLRLMQQTGLSEMRIKRLRVKNLVRHRVVNQTRMGKVASMYYLSVAGNGDGLLGIGEGKAQEAEDARKQAEMAAIRNMQPITRYESRTIYGEVEGKVSATELKLMARPPGFGLRCQHRIFEMAKCAGITDLAAKVTRSRNPMNTVKAAFEALKSQRRPEDIARARGKKFVDVRKVYYGGQV
ncbi:hypothetical protein L228DRAFT_241710 [Xylona heveae TC161]|uniref:Small ribosomal subunit protein uS5m n=1 Tax=Xylona heveae (strain CBS 132557 / TC161) TaxID=1328760 RepID=A0A164ZTG7_XYLHT|nr:hypothetical protein L228DRAFT_241710 [Xylona heveae TC161]KZF19491.1 hypothetical protein L228DRAFT_241710 [Xylona heveae TC161]